jgi:hypothetical protein
LKRSILILAAVSALSLTACSAPATQPPSAPDVAGATATPTPTPTSVEVDVTTAKSAKTSTGIEVTFLGTRIAEPSEIGSDPQPDMVAAVLQFEFRNAGTETVPLQAVPLRVFYGPDKYRAKQPTLYQGGTTSTTLPKQIAVGSVVKVTDTYWVPAGSAVTTEVDPSFSLPGVLPIVFSGITAK